MSDWSLAVEERLRAGMSCLGRRVSARLEPRRVCRGGYDDCPDRDAHYSHPSFSLSLSRSSIGGIFNIMEFTYSLQRLAAYKPRKSTKSQETFTTGLALLERGGYASKGEEGMSLFCLSVRMHADHSRIG